MVTVADFAGTWYLNGNRTLPCRIQLRGTQLDVIMQWYDDILKVWRQYTYSAHLIEGGNVIVADHEFTDHNHALALPKGTISSDLKRIAWINGEIWER